MLCFYCRWDFRPSLSCAHGQGDRDGQRPLPCPACQPAASLPPLVQNVLLTASGDCAKLADVGMARMMKSEGTLRLGRWAGSAVPCCCPLLLPPPPPHQSQSQSRLVTVPASSLSPCPVLLPVQTAAPMHMPRRSCCCTRSAARQQVRGGIMQPMPVLSSVELSMQGP